MQQQAVDTIDGPLLVLAGPGTGKTQLLSARVANILKKTDTNASNITCLTFTVNAANNMRERLRTMIGADANQVVIKTFHSLAADIIAANPTHFYAGAVLNPVSGLAAQEIMLSIFDKLPHSNPLSTKFDDKYSYLKSALDAITRSKDAGFTPTTLQQLTAEHLTEIEALEPELISIFSKSLSNKSLQTVLEDLDKLRTSHPSKLAEAIYRLAEESVEHDLPTGKTTQTGKLKSKLLSNEKGVKRMVRQRSANAWWQALCTVYEQYQSILYKRGYLDYSDMLISVIDALKKSDDLRLDIQESIQYLLIDEFQDSNESQIALMHLLADNPHIEAPNIMVVGDPNQTIYGFNGAMLTNTEDFAQHYQPHLKTIELTNNYRSSQQILDVSREVITPYSSFHPVLTADNPPSSTKVAFTAYHTEADQAVTICNQINSVLQQGGESSVAVLARGHKSLTYLSNYLTKAGFSINYAQSIDVRTTNGNRLIISVLSLIQAITTGNKQAVDYHMSSLLHHPVFALDPAVVWQIALGANRTNDWLKTASEHEVTKPITDWLHSLVGIAHSQSIDVLLEQLLSLEYTPQNTLYQKLFEADTTEQALVEASATRRLLEIAKQYAQTEQVSLAAFLSLFEATDNALFLFSPSVGHYDRAVTLMSVHGAKGLEFDHVFVIDADEKKWKPGRQSYPVPLSLPIHVNLDAMSDYARLMYVAMTRAKQTLHVSYVSRVDDKTNALPAEQIANQTFTQAKPVDIADKTTSEAVQLVPPRPPEKTMHELLADRLAQYRLSATTFTHFLDITRNDMQTFIEEQIVGIPGPTSAALARGNAMHAAMELLQIQTTNKAVNTDAVKRLIALRLREEALPENELQKLTEQLHQQLDLLLSLGLNFEPDSKPEQSYSATSASGLNMYGKIDRIDEVDQNTICIVDYKTGKPVENIGSKSEATAIKMWRYRMQLGFYAVLIRQQKALKNKQISAKIIQLDATDAQHLILNFEFGPTELDRIENLALAVYTRIKKLDFPDVSSYPQTHSGIQNFENYLLSK